MKSLYTFITEGVLSDIDDTLSNGTIYMDVENWLNEHYNIKDTYDINISKNSCVVNVNGDVRMKIVKGGYDALTNGMFEFGTVTGDFDANYQNFKDLTGSPRIVTGKFNIKDNKSPFTCVGGPDKVYSISLGHSCTSLEGMPQEVTSYVWARNASLNSLKGCGKAADYDFTGCELLESLEGIPACTCTINLCGCKKLKNLKGLENIKPEALRLESCKGLKSLEGVPSVFAKDYSGNNPLMDLRDTNLKSLKGIPANADWSNVEVDICGCDALEDISMLPKCAKLTAFYLPKLSKECYDNIKTYAQKVECADEFPMRKAKKSRFMGTVYLR